MSTLLSFLALLVFWMTAICTAPAQPQKGVFRQPLFPTLKVSGEAQVFAKPDLAVVRIGAVTQGSKAAEVQTKNNRIIHRTIEAIKALGISGEMIRTTSISLWPIYERKRPVSTTGEPPRIIAYRASSSLEVRVKDLSMAGKVIDAAMSSGANEILGITFAVEDETPYRQEALRKATLAAREKAQVIANALGLRVASLAEISEGHLQVFPPVPRMERALAMSKEATPVEPGLIRVNARVTAKFVLKGNLFPSRRE